MKYCKQTHGLYNKRIKQNNEIIKYVINWDKEYDYGERITSKSDKHTIVSKYTKV